MATILIYLVEGGALKAETSLANAACKEQKQFISADSFGENQHC